MLQGYRLKVRFRIHKYLYDGNVRTLVSRMQKPMLADYSGNAHDPATLCINEKKYLPISTERAQPRMAVPQDQDSGGGGQPGNSRSAVLPMYWRSAMPILLV